LPPSTTAPTKLEVLNEPTMYTVAPLEAPAPIPVPIPVPVEAPAPIPVPVPVPVSPVTNPLHITIANALKRRKTLRLHGRRAESNVPNRSSTKKRRFVQQP
jgi:hypothetical protein